MTPNPARWKYHQKLKKFQEGSDIWSKLLCKEFWDFWSSISRNFRDVWSCLVKTPSMFTNFCHNPSISTEFQAFWSLFHQFPSIYSIDRKHDQRHTKRPHHHCELHKNYVIYSRRFFVWRNFVCNLETNSPTMICCV